MVGNLYVSAISVENQSGELKRLELTDLEINATTIWTTEMKEPPRDGVNKIAKYRNALKDNGIASKIMARSTTTTVTTSEVTDLF